MNKSDIIRAIISCVSVAAIAATAILKMLRPASEIPWRFVTPALSWTTWWFATRSVDRKVETELVNLRSSLKSIGITSKDRD